LKESEELKKDNDTQKKDINGALKKDENNDIDNDSKKDVFQKSLLLFSIALLSLSDNHTRNIAKKMFINHSSKDKNNIIPLCLALLYSSEPDVEIIDCLSRSINSKEPINSILALGIVGAGTNNTRIGNLLEGQYFFNSKNTRVSSMLKVAQGLLYLGKGTLTLSPLFYDKTILNKKSFIGMVGLLSLFISEPSPVLGKHQFLFYLLEQCINNKFVMTLNSELDQEIITVRVGRPIMTVGMAGKPKGITAVVTHDSPVIVQSDEKGAIYEEEGWKYKGFVEDVVIIDKIIENRK